MRLHFPPITPRVPFRLRVALYALMLIVAATGYVVLNYGVIPGFDPYFQRRETGNIKILREGDRRLLWGGDSADSHFDITEFRLNPAHLEYGLGRERIPALIRPSFVSAKEADTWLEDTVRVLSVKIGEEVKVYPLPLMRYHEVVNDVVGGKPLFVAYCLLADLGAVYDRVYDGETFTFAVSGYTYYHWRYWRGYSAFVLWDRETESLWWPPMGKAVSGPSIDVPLHVLDTDLWAQTTWGKIRNKYPHAKVLKRRQGRYPPAHWPSKKPPRLTRTGPPTSMQTIPPRWGKNSEI